jgi:exonuclease SbcC
MLLKTLALRNYRKYKDAFVEFPDGVIGIIGLNGVGKTTLVEAIGWALFGHVAARTTKELIKREGASAHEPCSVALDFELEGDRYSVVREMTGKNLMPKASLMVNGKLITTNADEVSTAIQEKIGMDHLAFFTSVFARQKELNALSVMKAAERKKLVLRMLGIERIEKGIQAIREDKRGKEKRIEGIKTATVDQAGRKKIDVLLTAQTDLERTQQALEPVIRELEAVTARKVEQVTAARAASEAATRVYEQYVALNTQLSERRRDLANTVKRREEKEQELAAVLRKQQRLEMIVDQERTYFQQRGKKEELDQLRERYQRKTELERREARILTELQKRTEKLSTVRAQRQEFEGTEEQVAAVKRELEAVQRQKEHLHASLGALKSQVLQSRKEIDEQTTKKARIEDLGPESACPLCDRVLGAHYEILLAKLQEELDRKSHELQSIFTEYKVVKERLGSIQEDEAVLTQQNAALEQRITAMRALDSQIAHEEHEVAQWREELTAVQTDLESLRGIAFDPAAYKAVIASLANLEAVYHEILGLRAETARLGEVRKNLQTLHELERTVAADIREVERQIAALAFEKRDYEEKKASYEREQEELTELKLKLAGKRSEWEAIRRDTERVLAEIAEQQRLQAEKEKEETEIMYLSELEKLLNEFKLYMVGRIRPMLSEYASDLLRRLTDGKYSTMELDENYDIFVYDEGTAYELNRFSGGEEDLANLCLRLAISAVVTERSAIQTNFIILDEIFGSQDAYRKRNIMQALNALSKKYRQILLITHIEDVRDYMEYVLRVQEDEAGVSWVTAAGEAPSGSIKI